ncbi:thermonuclease family protein [Flavobacterium sp. TMP13]|uniref:thermonuclease family protein n=1 Tax=unclassified Flavobacterium TaxID=196869 RepID=UPI00076DDA40|nr:thermonuclease family protein [Flavobacterium sp. TAB 87]KVV14945.1 hypothetical protein AP058_01502 [Flavobacterium sp. TAB 87]
MKHFYILFGTLSLFFTLSVSAQSAKVIRVEDGNTIVVQDKNNSLITLTLAEVLCPDATKAFGKKAKKYTDAEVLNKVIEYNIINVDSQKRNIAIVFYDNKYLSEEIIKNGYGWHFKEESIYNFKILNDLENYAKNNKIGLWNDSTIIIPWEIADKVTGNRSQLSETRDPRR